MCIKPARFTPGDVKKPPHPGEKIDMGLGRFGAGAFFRFRTARPEGNAYFSEVEIPSKFVFRVEPIPLTAVMITIEMPAAIKPYSMAVAPDSSFRKREARFFIK
jgi:hypothetical protein